MPYRIDLPRIPADALDRLIALGALDVDVLVDGIAAVMPDAVAAEDVARAVGCTAVRVTPARGRDDGSVWRVQAGAVHVGGLRCIPADWPPQRGALRMIDGSAFGTGLHATTALCLEALQDELAADHPARVLDIGTGSGILALAALHAGVAHATAIDVDTEAVRVAAGNARLNGLASRLTLVLSGPDALTGVWPLVLANILAAPLVELAPVIARLVGRRGRLVLSGVRSSLLPDVAQAYRHVGLRESRTQARDGWTALTLQAPR